MNKAAARGAESRGDFYSYDPENLIIVDDPTHPLFQVSRTNIPFSEELVNSMMAFGFKGSVLVRQNGTAETGVPIIEVVDGRQRVKAAREANRRLKEARRSTILVPVAFERGNSEDAEAAMVFMNEVAVNEGRDPISRAREIKRLLDKGRPESEVLIMFGMSKRQLRSHLDLLSCSPRLRKAVEDEKVTLTVARTLSQLSEKEQDRVIEDLEQKGLTGKRSPAATKQVQEAAAASKGKTIIRARRASEIANLLASVNKNTGWVGREAVRATLQWVLGKDTALNAIVPPEVTL